MQTKPFKIKQSNQKYYIIIVLSSADGDFPHFTVYGEVINRKSEFCYLGSKITPTGGTSEDITDCINKVRAAFAQLKNIWTPNRLLTKKNPVSSTPASKPCKNNMAVNPGHSAALTRKLQTFVYFCHRRIMKIWWPRTISNRDLHKWTTEWLPSERLFNEDIFAGLATP